MKYLLTMLKVVCLLALTAPAFAQVHEVLMKNRGTAGPMVYEPDYLDIQPGDSVKFIRTHRSHNAASIAELSPEGYQGFIGKIDEEIEVKYDKPGLYGIKCSPHYAMGMVMLIKVGDAKLTDAYRNFKAPGVADKRLKAIFARMDAQ